MNNRLQPVQRIFEFDQPANQTGIGFSRSLVLESITDQADGPDHQQQAQEGYGEHQQR